MTNLKNFAAFGLLEEKSSIVNTGGLDHDFAKRIKKSLSKHVSYVINHPEEFAILPKYFTRIRKWPLERVLSTLFNMQHEDLSDVLLNCLPKEESLESPYTTNFIQQRSHLKPDALLYVFNHVLEDICRVGAFKTYHGYFLVAGDGSDISMPTEVIPSKPNEKHLVRYSIIWNI